MLGKIEGGENGTTEDETVGWHHRLNGNELEQAFRVGDGQGRLACCSPWGRKELDTTEQLNGIDKIACGHQQVFPVAQMVKNLPAMQETQVQSLGQEDPLEKVMVIHSSILAWRIL